MSIPTATNIKFKFKPAFDGLDDATIEFAIEEAVLMCGQPGDENWVSDANQTLATMYYAAHLLQVSIMRAESGTGQIVDSERTPDLSIKYSAAGYGKGGVLDFDTTMYGVRFAQLVRQNHPAVATVNSAVHM